MKIPRIPVSALNWRVIAAAVPVILVNAVAFAGQLAFLRAHLPWPLAGQVLVALALESVAVYLAAMAHLAALANDSALRLRLAAYGWALAIGAMNYSHYAGPGWRPTFPALATGLCSVASPWLWATYTRRVSRDRLLALGLVEPHALRLGATRWAWHPVRSAKVMYAATWEGITDPADALANYRREPEPSVAEPEPSKTPPPVAAPADMRSWEGVPVRVQKSSRAPSDDALVKRLRPFLVDDPDLSINETMRILRAGRPVAKRVLALASSNGNGSGPHD